SPTEKPTPQAPSKSTLKSATRTRLLFALFTSFCFLTSLVFLILVEVGNISSKRPIVGSIWFFKLSLANIVPQTVPNAVLINSIARTLGLHDFYQVGLWNYCEGYGEKIENCSKPKTLYWFDPVEIILSELLSGATIALPRDILTALGLVRDASHWMFALFLTAAPLSFLCIFLTPLSIYSRLVSLPIAFLSFLSALTTTAACIIATVLFIIFRNIINSQGADINIKASVGTKMFAFMWVAAAGAIVGWLVQMGMCCCCASRRDVKKGKKVGRRSAYHDGEVPIHDQLQQMQRGGRKRGWLGRKKE
ncbi:MAG: hypothetical protein Q9191_007281, partial [Dirinaria sp. TL-2023a]